jgi:hypothetical protein
MGDAALWGGSSMVVGMAANPQEAHQAGRHQVQPPRGSTTSFRITDRRAGDVSGTPISETAVKAE